MSRGFLDEDAAREEERDSESARTVEITGRIVSRHGRTLQFDSGDRQPHEIPLEHVRGSTQGRPGYVTLRLPEWFARKKGLI